MRSLGRRDLPPGSHHRAQEATRSTAEDQAQCQQRPLRAPNDPGKRSCIRSSFSSWLLSTSRTGSRRPMTRGARVRHATLAGHEHPGKERGSVCPAPRPDSNGAQQPSQPPSRPPANGITWDPQLGSHRGSGTPSAGWPRPSRVRTLVMSSDVTTQFEPGNGGPDPGLSARCRPGRLGRSSRLRLARPRAEGPRRAGGSTARPGAGRSLPARWPRRYTGRR